MAKTKKLPATVYIHVENEGEGEDEYFAVSETVEEITVERGKRLRVGEYVLNRQVEISTETRVVTEVG